MNELINYKLLTGNHMK